MQTVADAGPDDLPLVLIPDSGTLFAPSTLEVAAALGLRTSADNTLYDLCIVGAGPAGLAAAVYGASEGLRTIVVEREAPGRASGPERGHRELPRLPERAVRCRPDPPRRRAGEPLRRRDGRGPRCHAARRPRSRQGAALGRRDRDRGASGDRGHGRLLPPARGRGRRGARGRGVYYGASASDASQCEGDDVYVVGAANSAGQAALNMARFAKRVVLVVRGSSLEASMSSYLVERIVSAANIEVRLRSEVVACQGEGHLERLALADLDTGVREEVSSSWLFVFIGASPRTSWLGDTVTRDEKGFIVTGLDLLGPGRAAHWPLAQAPSVLETSVPGVFAAGDVRLDSMKRVASAVGEGAMATYLVHRYLATT